MAALVITHRAQREDFMPQLLRVSREIERRPAQMFALFDDVPQDFAHAQDAHALDQFRSVYPCEI